MSIFKIVRETELSREDEIAILYKRGISKEKLTKNLLYDREWCEEHEIRYHNLRSPFPNLSASKIARNFVKAAIQK